MNRSSSHLVMYQLAGLSLVSAKSVITQTWMAENTEKASRDKEY